MRRDLLASLGPVRLSTRTDASSVCAGGHRLTAHVDLALAARVLAARAERDRFAEPGEPRVTLEER